MEMGQTNNMRKHIVNADDFGRDSCINAAILRCFERQWISSATVMANMPGFEEACQIIHEHQLIGRIGVHVVLSMGRALTDAIKRETRFCDENGMFRPRPKHKRFFHLKKSERTALAYEVAAQIEKCRDHGLRLAHLDSHHHFHEEWGVIGVILPLVQNYNIPYVRIMRNTRLSWCVHKKIYAALYNTRLRRLKLARTRFFGSIYDYIDYLERFPCQARREVFEIMVHPNLDVGDEVIDTEKDTAIEQLIATAGLQCQIQSFSEKEL